MVQYVYHIGDEPLEIEFEDEDLVISTQDSAECPMPIVYDVQYANGDSLDPDLLVYDPSENRLEVFTDNVVNYLDNLSHDLVLNAYYSELGPLSGI